MQTGTANLHPELLAAITAVLSCAIEGPFLVRSVQPEAAAAPVAAGSAWAKAGLMEQHLTRRSFVARSR
jgi:hypothetical protein